MAVPLVMVSVGLTDGNTRLTRLAELKKLGGPVRPLRWSDWKSVAPAMLVTNPFTALAGKFVAAGMSIAKLSPGAGGVLKLMLSVQVPLSGSKKVIDRVSLVEAPVRIETVCPANGPLLSRSVALKVLKALAGNEVTVPVPEKLRVNVSPAAPVKAPGGTTLVSSITVPVSGA